MFLFGLFRAAFAVVKFVGSVIAAAVKAVVSVVKHVARAVVSSQSVVTATLRSTVRQVTGTEYSPGWDLIVHRHFDWKRALFNQDELDDERDRLADQLGDDDSNGIPDLYDSEVTTPAQDFLEIKYPPVLLRENDYVRFLPRRVGAMAQPVMVGGKGLIRSETVTNIGQIVMVKWNALNPRGRVDAPLYPANAMDLYLLGHVYDGGHLTR